MQVIFVHRVSTIRGAIRVVRQMSKRYREAHKRPAFGKRRVISWTLRGKRWANVISDTAADRFGAAG